MLSNRLQRPRKTTPQPPIPLQDDNHFDNDVEGEVDDEISQQMTASYSEISFKSGVSPENENPLSLTMDPLPLAEHIMQRPVTLSCDRNIPSCKPLGPLNLEGTVHIEGNMTHFVAEDLEYKIKLSSPVTKKGGTSDMLCKSVSFLSTCYLQIHLHFQVALEVALLAPFIGSCWYLKWVS